ncbi:MAG: T9SS type A sorting domain-containing protein [Candidatus Hadarchaeum sp.]
MKNLSLVISALSFYIITQADDASSRAIAQGKYDEGNTTVDFGQPTLLKPYVPGTDSLVLEITRAKQSGDVRRAQKLMHDLDSLYGIGTSIETQTDPSSTIEQINATANPLHSFTIANSTNAEKAPFLMVRKDGAYVHVAYETWAGTSHADTIYISRFTSSWSRLYKISSTTRRHAFPSLAYLPPDSFIVLYDGTLITGGGDIFAAIAHNTGLGGRTLAIDTDSDADTRPRVASDEVPPTYVYAAYQTNRKVTVRRSVDEGRTWSNDLFSYTVSRDIQNVWITVDRTLISNIYVSWSVPDTLYISKSTDYGVNWTVPTRLYHSGVQSNSVAATNGKVIIAYCRQFSGDDWDAWYYYSTNAGSSWARTSVNTDLTFEAYPTVSAEPGTGANYFSLFYRAGGRRVNTANVRGALIPISNPSSFSPLSHTPGDLTGYISDADFVSTGAQPSGNPAHVAWAYRFNNTDDFDLSSAPGMWTGVPVPVNAVAATYALSSNYPNPFNLTTNIEFALPKRSIVTVRVFDLLGREVVSLVDQTLNAGIFRSSWDGFNSEGKATATGVYFLRMVATPLDGGQPFIQTRKMILAK